MAEIHRGELYHTAHLGHPFSHVLKKKSAMLINTENKKLTEIEKMDFGGASLRRHCPHTQELTPTTLQELGLITEL